MIELTWLGHAGVTIDVDGVRILTDPLLRRHVGLLRRPGPAADPQSWADADVVLLSHLHHDHADLPSLRMTSTSTVIGSEPIATWALQCGLRSRAIGHQWTPIKPGSSVEVRLVRAVHHSRRMPHRPNAAHGFLLRGEGWRAWFAGDTSAYPQLSDLPDLAGGPIDVALLPIHGWGPRLSDGHLDSRSAALVCAQVGIRQVLPIHYGTFHAAGMQVGSLEWMHRPLAHFRESVAELSPATRVIGPRHAVIET